MLLFGTEVYLTGALCSAYIYKQTMTKKQRETIDVVCLVEERLYTQYKDVLLKVYDNVYSITMDALVLSDEYKHRLSKKGKYTPHLASLYTNKWKCFNLVEYEKVLFMDMDIIPKQSEFYNVFELPTPAAMINSYPIEFKKYPIKMDSSDWFVKPVISKNISTLVAKNIKHSINGGIFLFTPSKDLHNSYFRFLKNLQKPLGYSSLTESFPDETSLILYFAGFLKKIINIIPNIYSQPYWSFKKGETFSLNYLTPIKPWNIPKQLLYKSDHLWHEVAEKIFKTNFMKLIHVHNQLQAMLKQYGSCVVKDEPAFILEFLTSNYERVMYEKLAKNKAFFQHILELTSNVKKC